MNRVRLLLLRSLILGLAASAMSGWGGSDDDDDPIPLDGLVQFVNAISDSPPLTLTITDASDEEISVGTQTE